VAILGRDDPGAWALAPGVHGRLLSFGRTPLPPGDAGTAVGDDGAIWLQGQRVLERGEIALRGEHNRLNVAAACAIAAAAGLPVEAMRQGVQGFTGAPHRLQFVRNWGGAAWYNDSIATAPERSMADIRSFDEPLVLLAGGRDKHLPWDDFAALVCQRVETLVLFGEAADLIAQAFQPGTGRPRILRCGGLHEAVQAAAGAVRPGSVVLLSPGGTSFDEFKDFEERGECFVQWVNELP
jgi:UDP-N-acetylmuramoylalanine--D-glutamate ligase